MTARRVASLSLGPPGPGPPNQSQLEFSVPVTVTVVASPAAGQGPRRAQRGCPLVGPARARRPPSPSLSGPPAGPAPLAARAAAGAGHQVRRRSRVRHQVRGLPAKHGHGHGGHHPTGIGHTVLRLALQQPAHHHNLELHGSSGWVPWQCGLRPPPSVNGPGLRPPAAAGPGGRRADHPSR